jgi:V/A-type H+/Na+-transporting ATPase subunit E
MADKLQELTERIYQEGVGKSKEEAERILAAARHQAEEILRKAESDAAAVRKSADAAAEELRKNVQSEVKLASQQMLSALKQKIVDLIAGGLVDVPVKDAWNQVDFMKKLALGAVERWEPKSDLALEFPETLHAELEAFFKAEGKKLLDAGATITFDGRLTAGFRIGPANGTYKVSFTDEDFATFFKLYLRPKAVRILYGE